MSTINKAYVNQEEKPISDLQIVFQLLIFIHHQAGQMNGKNDFSFVW